MSDGSLWHRIEPLLSSCERPSRYIDHERGVVRKPDAGYRAVLIYPDTYEIGQANLGLALLYQHLNRLEGIACERSYLPWVDMVARMRDEGLPLFSLESYLPVSSFDLVGITFPHEMAVTNILEAIDLAGIPLHADQRGPGDPLVIGGGPCAYNPEPLVPFFDLFNIGEGEEALCAIVLRHRQLRDAGLSRKAILRELSELPGVYVPSLTHVDAAGVVRDLEGKPLKVVKQVYKGFAGDDALSEPLVPYIEMVHDRLNIEILRGCSRGCRFCQAGMIYRPVRERSSDRIVAAACDGLKNTGYDQVSLTSLSSTDHSRIDSILRRLTCSVADSDISISIPSQRLDAFGVEMAQLIAGTKKAGLTFAPEAGTQRLRDIINKNVTEEDLLAAVSAAYQVGWRRCKLYFMVGLPGEEDEDIRGLVHLANKAYARAKDSVPDEQRNNVRMGISLALFIPKSHTPFQWCPQADQQRMGEILQIIRDSHLHKGIDFHWRDSKDSLLESVIARGGREVSALIERAWRKGCTFDAWSERFSPQKWEEAAGELGIDLEEAACRSFDLDQVLPWDHISCGVSKEYLLAEYQAAQEGKTTPDCTFTGCTGCGACPELGIWPQVEGERS